MSDVDFTDSFEDFMFGCLEPAGKVYYTLSGVIALWYTARGKFSLRFESACVYRGLDQPNDVIGLECLPVYGDVSKLDKASLSPFGTSNTVPEDFPFVGLVPEPLVQDL